MAARLRANELSQIQPNQSYWVHSPRYQIISQAGGPNNQTGSVKYFIHNNHLGSVSLTTDKNGEILSSGEARGSQYLPYGAPANAQNTELQPYGFSAKERDASELMYFEARYYDPLSTRFISPDPLFAAELEKCIESIVECNLYQYTGNNPINWLDLLGLDKKEFNLSNFNSSVSREFSSVNYKSNVDFSSTNLVTTNSSKAPIINGTLPGSNQGVKIDAISGKEVSRNIFTGESNSYTFSGVSVESNASIYTSGGASKTKFNDQTGSSVLSNSIEGGVRIPLGRSSDFSLSLSYDPDSGGSTFSGTYSKGEGSVAIETAPEFNVFENISRFISTFEYAISDNFFIDNFEAN